MQLLYGLRRREYTPYERSHCEYLTLIPLKFPFSVLLVLSGTYIEYTKCSLQYYHYPYYG